MIKVLIPEMPTADELLPYLRLIDQAKVYVNGGQMVKRLELELSALTRAPCAVVSNGTVSMELALRAMDLPRGAGVLVPPVTYVASGQAIVNAGLVPVLCDVEADTWQLSAERAAEIVAADKSIKAVMPVAAFGLPVPIEPWERFNYETNLPVLIDAAGAIYGQQTSPIPEIVVSFSLHATKALGAGEGGALATHDLILLERVASMASFGPGGTNAKMSEYHAAVALASMKRPMRSDGDGRTWVDDLGGWYLQLPTSIKWPVGARQDRRTLFPILLPERAEVTSVFSYLRLKGIETKQWYAPFLDARTEFHNYPNTGLCLSPAMLRYRLLGLPWHAFLTEDDVAAVCEKLSEALA